MTSPLVSGSSLISSQMDMRIKSYYVKKRKEIASTGYLRIFK